jgi:uncharacterized protein YcfJ
MKHLALAAALAGSMAVAGCATNPYGYNDPYYGGGYGGGGSSQAGNVAKGGIAGAAIGAGVGAIVPGVSTIEGAIAGGIAGAVLGAVVNGKQYYRDTRGYCYYVDQYNRPIYDYNARC